MAWSTTTNRDDEVETSFRIVTFTGEDALWREWSTKIKAIARRKGWFDAIMNDTPLDRASADPAVKAAAYQNDEAFSYLILACSGAVFPYVENAAGNARTAWQNLSARYESNSTIELLGLYSRFIDCLPTDDFADPNIWFFELEHLRERILQSGGSKKTDDEVIAHIIRNCPKTYRTTR